MKKIVLLSTFLLISLTLTASAITYDSLEEITARLQAEMRHK